MNLFTAKVANYFGHGNTRTDYSNSGWSWNILSLKLGRYKVSLTQNKDIISNRIKPQGFVYTTDVVVAGIKTYEEGERVVNDLCRLLSLASFSQVVPFSYSFNGIGRKPNITAEGVIVKCGVCQHDQAALL